MAGAVAFGFSDVRPEFRSTWGYTFALFSVWTLSPVVPEFQPPQGLLLSFLCREDRS